MAAPQNCLCAGKLSLRHLQSSFELRPFLRRIVRRRIRWFSAAIEQPKFKLNLRRKVDWKNAKLRGPFIRHIANVATPVGVQRQRFAAFLPNRIAAMLLSVQYMVYPHDLLILGLRVLAVLAGFWAVVRIWRRMALASTRKEPIPAPTQDIVAPASGWEAGQRETAIFAGGCFWGVQSVFQRVKGVVKTTVGYTGGLEQTADYRRVSGGDTDHAEAIEIVFDPSKVSYGTLLRIFFSVVHDPTQLNRQGADTGTQYRSAIFFTDERQREVAQAYVHQLDGAHIFPRQIVTTITPLERFYAGEEYHQDYAMKNPHNPYIQVCDIPKIASLGQQFPELFQEYSL